MFDYLEDSPTFRLMPVDGFLDGVASIIDLAGEYPQYNTSSSPEEADRLALLADYRAICLDGRR